MIKNPYKKIWIFGILIIFLGASILPGINAKIDYFDIDEKNLDNLMIAPEEYTSTVTLFAVGETQSKENKIEISTVDAEIIFNMFKELKEQIIQDPNSEKTQDLRNQFVSLLDEKGMLPKGTSKDEFISLLSPPSLNQPKSNTVFNKIYNLKKTMINPLFNRITQILNEKYYNVNIPIESFSTSATANFCTLASYGDGYTIPVIIPVRPRLGIAWQANFSQTYAGEVFSNKGFYATGAQSGSTIGFTGGGGTFAFPWAKFYVVVGYTWHVTVNADHIDFFPPNYEPEISDLNPPNKAVDVPVSLSELSFKLYDVEGAPMDYKVITYPDIGSGEGKGKPNGQYSIPVSNLDGSTTYTWTIQVSDDKNNIEKSFTFTTELEYPIISDPSPSDGETWVPADITELSFKINDPQHDPMDYTVETVPDIGSDSATGVADGTYTCDISNLEYTTIYKWYINATDGEHLTRKTYSFQTQPIMVFDPFDEGWMYRKNITIDHTKVAGNLNNFPVLISITDEDLKNKAQNDGDDILFMDGAGTATRLFHEIEQYESSTGELVAWVNINSLSNSADTVLYLYYGNPSCGNQQFQDKVWDSDHCGVWHLNDFYDSTINGNDGINHGTEDYTGKIGNAKDFTETEKDYIKLSDMPEPADGSNSRATFEAWVNPESEDTHSSIICKLDTSYEPDIRSYKCEILKTGQIRFSAQSGTYYPSGDIIRFTTDDNLITAGTWQHIVAVIDLSIKNNTKLYYNGEEQDWSIIIVGTAPSHFYDVNLEERLGILAQESGSVYYDGAIDEVRVSKIFRNYNWLKTSFNTMNDPSNFFNIGPEESSP